ncbi:MAG TPA: phosphorylase [Casimicrobiaceae bacterium]|nr:phosphorylase [Casimicrobiaceae bacterium]
MSRSGFVVAACGLALEARIASGDDVQAVAGAVDRKRLASALEREVARGAGAVMSFGIAGGLAPDFVAGTWIVGRGVIAGAEYRRSDDAWTQRLLARLPGARFGDIAGSDAPIATADAKRALHAATSALAIDTESHIAADIASAHGLPFAAFRVIADPVSRDLPPAASVALTAHGNVDVVAVLRSLVAAPWQLPLLARTAIDARTAFAALRRARERLGDDLRAAARDA